MSDQDVKYKSEFGELVGRMQRRWVGDKYVDGNGRILGEVGRAGFGSSSSWNASSGITSFGSYIDEESARRAVEKACR